MKEGGCFNSSQTGHHNRDCMWGLGVFVCFHCNQKGHKKDDHPRLLGGAMRVPTPATLRITNDRECDNLENTSSTAVNN